jgi:heme/copper-type cytochrome/quinol oxidase subunit 3
MSAVLSAPPIDASLETVPAPPPRRPRVLLVGAAFAAVASSMVVLTMLAAYLQIRGDRIDAGVTALPESIVLPLTPGNMGLLTIAMSAFTMAWLVHSLRNDDRKHAYLALGITILLGGAFINATAYLYQQIAMPLTTSGTSGLLYAVTGAHLLMVFVGLVFTAVMGFHALGGQLTGRDAESMTAAAVYWYVTVAVYVAVWYGIYITK